MNFLQGAIHNEYIKKRNRIFTMSACMVALVAIVLLVQLINYFVNFIPEQTPQDAWNITLSQEASQLQQQLDSSNQWNPTDRETAEKRLTLIQYHLNNDIPPSLNGSVHSIMNSMKGVFIKLILPVLMIIVGGDIFSADFSTRTLKLSLLSPLGRTRLVLAKWLCLMSVSSLILLVMYTFLFVLNLKNGLGDVTAPIVIYLKSPEPISAWVYLLIGLIANLLVIACYSSFILFVSYFVRSVAISSALLLGVCIFASLLIELRHKLPPLRFLFFNHTDLMSQLSGASANGFSIGNSALILAATTAILYAAVWTHFRRCDLNV